MKHNKHLKCLSTTLLFLLPVVSAVNCEKRGDSDACTQQAIVIDAQGLDGCNWLIELEDGTRLEPVFDETVRMITLKDQSKISIDYELVPEAMSICMGGKTARITCITELPD